MKRIISTILALTVLIGTFGVVYASADTYQFLSIPKSLLL